MESVKIISTNANPNFAVDVWKNLPTTDFTNKNIKYHANTEIKVQIEENVRGQSVYIISTGTVGDGHSINDHLMEVLLLTDACKRSDAKSICLIMPCFPYARSDKKDDGRCSIGASLVTNLLIQAGVTRIVSVDLHAGQIQGFCNIPFDNLYAIKIFTEYLKLRGLNDPNKCILISPDNGGAKRVNHYAEALKMEYAIMNKQRDYSTESKVEKTQLISTSELTGRIGIVIDDMVDTCGTMIASCNELKSHKLGSVIILATHGIFSGQALERINNCDFIQEVIVTNSLPQEKNMEKCKKLKVVDISQLVSQVIYRLQTKGSISELFK